MRTMLKSKIHRARVTQVDLDYEGSITIDRSLMEASDILPFERVEVLNINNGARFSTYAIEGEANSGIIGINGAAARLVAKGDIVIIVSYCQVPDDEAIGMTPSIVHVDSQNRIVEPLSMVPLRGWQRERVGVKEEEKILSTKYEMLNNIKTQNPNDVDGLNLEI
ncbi:MAG: aspartate 1-decarboxylase [Dehalococcoidia bacterium]|nr:aspartate 1-decarboxylase [Dehalococcoidia bacterium]